jgi:hypothetical protein
MAIKYNIPTTKEQALNTSELIIKTFGLGTLKTAIYKPGIAKVAFKPIDINPYDANIPTPPTPDSPSTHSFLPQYPSFLNTAVFSDLNLTAIAVNGTKISVQIPTVLFSVTQTKNIITTSIQGRNGTVKEYISDGDYKINIKGVITNSNGKYPQTQIDKGLSTVNDLFQMCQLNKALTVESWYLYQFCVYELVITDFEFPQLEGQYSSQPFEINAISDTPYVINNTKAEIKKVINRDYIPFI